MAGAGNDGRRAGRAPERLVFESTVVNSSMNTPLKSILAAGFLALASLQTATAETFQDGVAAAARADYASALRIFGEAAAKGDAKSQYALAEMYRQGQGAPRDYGQALTWYRKAADQANPGAQFALGVLYQTGQGVARDDRAAASWYAKAADQGYASAEVGLGVLYAEGRGAAQSDAMAKTWFQKAADQGDLDGQLQLEALAQKVILSPKDQFRAMMDRVFGSGRWRETSGYRSRAKENQLRKEGAGTVAAGERSHHSMGGPDAPGAYDIVIDGMPLQRAAAKLKRSREQLARVVAETAHGNQGPHLHVEPRLTRASSPTPLLAGGDRIVIDARDRAVATAATSPAGTN